MKKILAIILAIVIALGLCSCGNHSVGFGNYEFKKIHINTFNYSGCLTINKWYSSDTGIEVKTEEIGNVFLSEGTYILWEDECLICKGGDTNE